LIDNKLSKDVLIASKNWDNIENLGVLISRYIFLLISLVFETERLR